MVNKSKTTKKKAKKERGTKPGSTFNVVFDIPAFAFDAKRSTTKSNKTNLRLFLKENNVIMIHYDICLIFET